MLKTGVLGLAGSTEPIWSIWPTWRLEESEPSAKGSWVFSRVENLLISE